MDSGAIGTNRLYGDLAYLMPLVSPPEEYIEEASCWWDALRGKLGHGRFTILELGVGGGCNLSHLTGDFDAVAVDSSEPMLNLCREINPSVTLHLGDMRSIRLGRKFPAIMIHDAISYMLTDDDIRATLKTVVAHLEEGGVFITSPDRFAETFKPPVIDYATNRNSEIELTYFEYTHDPNPEDTEVESIMLYIIKSSEGVRVECDRHITGLFPKSAWVRLMQEAGFFVEEKSYYLETACLEYTLLVGTLSRKQD